MTDIEADPGWKLLFKHERWQICESERGVWVWHKACPDMPKDEIEVNQECWIPSDDNAHCIVCEKKLPDEILALVLLYTNAV